MLGLKKNLLIKRIRSLLIIGFSKRAGKNCFGRKTIFTQSGGYKLFYNNLDFKRNMPDIFVLLRIEKSILYTSFLGFICYSNGYFCYIFLSDFIKNLKTIYSGFVTNYKYAPSFLSLIPAVILFIILKQPQQKVFKLWERQEQWVLLLVKKIIILF